MKVSPATLNTTLAKVQTDAPPPGAAFEGILKDITHNLNLPANLPKSVERSLGGPQAKIYSDLLKTQNALSRFHLTVELCSKAGESAAATARRFQQGG